MSQAQAIRRLNQKYPYKLTYWIEGRREETLTREDFKTRTDRFFRMERIKLLFGSRKIIFEYDEV